MALIKSGQHPRQQRQCRRRRQLHDKSASTLHQNNVSTHIGDVALAESFSSADVSSVADALSAFVDAIEAISPLLAPDRQGNATNTAYLVNSNYFLMWDRVSTAASSLLEAFDHTWDTGRNGKASYAGLAPDQFCSSCTHSYSVAHSLSSHQVCQVDFKESIAFECCIWWLNLIAEASTQQDIGQLSLLLQRDMEPLSMWVSGLKRLAVKASADKADLLDLTDENNQADFGPFETCAVATPSEGVTDKPVHVASTRNDSVETDAEVARGFPIGDILSYQQEESNSTILIAGSPGSGKTYGCDRLLRKIQRRGHSILAVRPDIPLDVLGGTIKKSTSRSFSFVAFSERSMFQQDSSSILVLDDFDSIVLTGSYSASEGTSEARTSSTHESSMLRARVSLNNIFDAIRQRQEELKLSAGGATDGGGNLLIVLTSRNSDGFSTTKFDHVLELSTPDDEERRQIISEWLFPDDVTFSDESSPVWQHQSKEEFLDEMVNCTRGRSRSEISHYCRHGIFIMSGVKNISKQQMRFQRIKRLFQSTSAASVQNTAVANDDISVQVLGPTALSRLLTGYNSEVSSGIRKVWDSSSWDQLQSAILTPLCHSQDIRDLLHGNGVDARRFKRDAIAGVLLTGKSGSGKSTMARYCAAVASSRLPSVCLLDVNCVSLVHKGLGESERSVRRMFALARAAAPCILLLDGIEHIAHVRGRDDTTHGTMDRILSTVLTEMDGMNDDSSLTTRRIAVIGVTPSRSWIDPAICRPGRLERCVELDP